MRLGNDIWLSICLEGLGKDRVTEISVAQGLLGGDVDGLPRLLDRRLDGRGSTLCHEFSDDPFAGRTDKGDLAQRPPRDQISHRYAERGNRLPGSFVFETAALRRLKRRHVVQQR